MLRKPGMPMRSFSMAKTFTAMLVGIAHGKGLIRSLDDKASDYWPEIADSAYGQTTIRNLLRMSSGVPFKELYTWTPDDDNWVWGQVLYAPNNTNSPARIGLLPPPMVMGMAIKLGCSPIRCAPLRCKAFMGRAC